MTALALFALAGCLTVGPGSDQIRTADLAPAFPEMANLDEALMLAPAPAPGVVRVLHPAELRRLAALYGLTSAPGGDICVVRKTARLEPEPLLEAMQHAFPAARIELLEYSQQPAPDGIIEFPKTGLRTGPAGSPGSSLWIGAVRFGVNRRFSVWARVKIVVRVNRVLALTDLRPGQSIAAAQVELAARDETLTSEPAAALAGSLVAVIGKWPRQPIRAGEAIRSAWLQPAQAVLNGDMVRVAVRNGGAQLELEARAEGSGAVGETIYVRNPTSHRRFRARVEGRGRATVDDNGAEPQELQP